MCVCVCVCVLIWIVFICVHEISFRVKVCKNF